MSRAIRPMVCARDLGRGGIRPLPSLDPWACAVCGCPLQQDPETWRHVEELAAGEGSRAVRVCGQCHEGGRLVELAR